MIKGNKYRVYGICTDAIKKNGNYVLRNGQKIFGAIGWYRVVNPLKKLGAEVSVGHIVSNSVENALELKDKGDIWFCKMVDNSDLDLVYGTHKEFTGSKFVLDVDDEPEITNEDHPDFKELELRKDMRVRMVKMADHVVVTNETLKQSIMKWNPYVTVIPNAIDPEIWKVKKPPKRTDGKIRIVWISSGSHYTDLPIIQDIVNELMEKYPQVEFHFAGMDNDNIKKDRYYHHTGTEGYADFPQYYADIDADIAIAPLKDNHFNRCKSNIKWMEAAMLELPVVASDVLPYQCIKHGQTGFLATGPAQFKKYLERLITDPELRKRIGKAAKEDVLANWTIDKFLPLYEDLFTKLLDKKEITVITAITNNKDDLTDQPYYPGVEYLAFVDGKSSTWKTKKPCDKFVQPVMNAKIHKVLSHKYCDTPYIVWMDGNCSLKKDPHELVKLMGDKDYAFFKHPARDCVYDEMDACVRLNKGKIQEIGEQGKEYARRNYPAHNGLCELTCFVRKNNEHANTLFEKWWAEICRFSNRDQISFPVVFQGEKWATIPGTIGFIPGNDTFKGNEYFKYSQHNHYE